MKETSIIMNEEKLLQDICGKENPFRTPEGYFDALPQTVMSRIHRKRKRLIMWRWAAAAVMTGIVSTASLLFVTSSDGESFVSLDNLSYYESELDYSMINNQDIINYLTEAE